MRLTAWEEERLLIFTAAELARRHRAQGLLLNHPETVALICDAMLEAARAGASYADIETAGRAAVKPAEVMDGVAALVDEVRLEVLMADGTRLVVLVDPVGPGVGPADGPGAVRPAPGAREGPGDGRERLALVVRSTSRRTIRISSHFPFHEANPRLEFDRAAAAGYRLDLPAGASECWSPGETKSVALVRYGGDGDRREAVR